MGQKKKIYVAGQYSPKVDDPHDASRVAFQNTRKAILAGIALLKMGHYPYIPHLSHFVHLEADVALPSQYWVDMDLVWLAECDAILMLPGWEQSSGARQEHAYAKDHGLAIYYTIDDVPIVDGKAGETG